MKIDPMLLAGCREVESGIMGSTFARERLGTESRQPGQPYVRQPSTFQEFDCNLVPIAGDQKVEMDRMAGGDTYHLFLPHDADVLPNDQGIIDGTFAVSVYSVRRPESPDAIQKVAVVVARD